MAEFVIVIAAAAGLAASTPAPNATSVPLSAPTVGFRTYPDVASCERATVGLVVPAGKRLVCLPIDRDSGEMASAY
jgi:hypothetical protein